MTGTAKRGGTDLSSRQKAISSSPSKASCRSSLFPPRSLKDSSRRSSTNTPCRIRPCGRDRRGGCAAATPRVCIGTRNWHLRQADLGHHSFPDQPIPLFPGVVVVVILACSLSSPSSGWIPYRWRGWITSVDHKRIGVTYATLAAVAPLRVFHRACHHHGARSRALAFQSQGYLPPEHHNPVSSPPMARIMIFFVRHAVRGSAS